MKIKKEKSDNEKSLSSEQDIKTSSSYENDSEFSEEKE